MTFPGNQRSLTGKIWSLRASGSAQHHEIARDLGLGPVFAPLLASRELDSTAKVHAFMSPRLQNLADPALLQDMEPAVARIVHALVNQELMAIFGDYDVDGATSSALLDRYFRALGVAVRVYIPDRLTEGYGPNVAAMNQLAGEGVRLLITVDCGISAFEALRVAAERDMDVIVTDHHQPAPEGLPTAFAVINPNRTDDTFPHKELAGVGVAFYLVMALNRHLRQLSWFNATRPEPDLKSLLDLVALGTVSDMAKLCGVNRTLVYAGIKVAAQTRKPGLQALYQLSGIPLEAEVWGVGVDQIGFLVGPRINAGGRLDRGSLGYELLASEDGPRVEEIAQILDASNRERREIEKRIFDEAVTLIEARQLAENRCGLVVAGENWHPGVVGIVASRLVERYHRPAVVAAIDGEGRAKASGRSIPGVDLLAAIQENSRFLTTFGGHRAAVGLSLSAAMVEPFALAFDGCLRKIYPPETFWPVLTVDGTLPMAEAHQQLVAQLQRFQPFGMGNPEPVFVLEQVRVSAPRLLKERHVKCLLSDGQGRKLEAIAFRCWPGPLGEGLMRQGAMAMAGVLSINRFRGEERVQLLIKDARP